MPNVVKIGMTTNSPYERAEQLSTTGVPRKFVVEEYWKCSSDELRNIEKDIHKKLRDKRYSKNREFFSMSVADAKHFISDYFKRKSELEIERIKEEEEIERRYKDAKNVMAAKEKIEKLIIDGTDSLLDEINSNKNKIQSYLESVLHAEDVVNLVGYVNRNPALGKIVSYNGWSISASYSYHGGHRRAKQLQEDNAKVYIFISVQVKRAFRSAVTYGGFFSASYLLHSGELDVSQNDTALNELVRNEVIPKTLYELFRLSGLNHIAEHWNKVFGDNAEIRMRIKCGVECPACNNGELLLRKRRKDNKPFYGCSKWPACNFAFNVLPTISIKDAVVTSDNSTAKETGSEDINNSANVVSTDTTLSSLHENNLVETESNSGFSIWYIIGIVFFLKIIIALTRL